MKQEQNKNEKAIWMIVIVSIIAITAYIWWYIKHTEHIISFNSQYVALSNNKPSAKWHDPITFYVLYHPYRVMVTCEGQEVPVNSSAPDSNEYLFYMPFGDVTISVLGTQTNTIVSKNEHTITYQNGVTLLKGNTAFEHDTVYYRVKKDSIGYELKNVVIGNTTVDKNKTMFIMPDHDVTIVVNYEKIQVEDVELPLPLKTKHKITTDDPHIVLNVSEAYQGEKISFQISDRQGYNLKKIIINSRKYDNSLRSFIMGNENVHIALEYEKIKKTDTDNSPKNTNDVEIVNKADGSKIETIYYKGKISSRKYLNSKGDVIKIEIYNEFGKLKDTIIY